MLLWLTLVAAQPAPAAATPPAPTSVVEPDPERMQLAMAATERIIPPGSYARQMRETVTAEAWREPSMPCWT